RQRDPACQPRAGAVPRYAPRATPRLRDPRRAAHQRHPVAGRPTTRGLGEDLRGSAGGDVPRQAHLAAERSTLAGELGDVPRQRAASAAAVGVDAIEVHNEPNLAMEWPHGPNAWEYTQMLRVAYTAIKAADPSIIVVSGGLAPTITTQDRGAISDLDFAEEML